MQFLFIALQRNLADFGVLWPLSTLTGYKLPVNYT